MDVFPELHRFRIPSLRRPLFFSFQVSFSLHPIPSPPQPSGSSRLLSINKTVLEEGAILYKRHKRRISCKKRNQFILNMTLRIMAKSGIFVENDVRCSAMSSQQSVFFQLHTTLKQCWNFTLTAVRHVEMLSQSKSILFTPIPCA